MDTIHQFIDQNMPLLHFLYGLSFFMLGLVAAIQYRSQSRLKIVHNLWVLSLFGLSHGLAEWGNVFIPIQILSLTPAAALWVRTGQVFLLMLSFVVLIQFGVNLIIAEETRSRKLALVIPGASFLIWAIALFSGFALVDKANLIQYVKNVEAAGRYLFALPGAVLAGIGLTWQSKDFVGQIFVKARVTAKYVAVTFYFYAFFSGVIGPAGDFFPANFVNSTIFHNLLGLPVELFRMIIIFFMTYYIFALLEHFEDELTGRLEWAECQYSVLNERLRISRDLHDGILQSVYAMGLRYENLKHLLDEIDLDKAKAEIDLSIKGLNQLIAEIRSFIGELRVDSAEQKNLYSQLQDMVEEFGARSQVEVQVKLSGLEELQICPKITDQIIGVVREALNNVARHSGASKAYLEAQSGKRGLWLRVSDNGKGFRQPNLLMAKFTLGHQGIANMRDRARLLGGELEVRSSLGKGTKVSLYLPKQGLNQACGGGITCGGCGTQTYSHNAR